MLRRHSHKMMPLLAMMLISSTALSQDLTQKGRYWVHQSTRQFNVEVDSRLHISGLRGKVTVSVWDKEIVQVEQTLSMDVFTQEEAQEVLQKAQNSYIQKKSTLYIGGKDLDRNWLNTRFVLQVPRRLQCHIQLSGGDIEINGLHGPLLATTGAGEIDLSEITGDIKTSTGAGEIEVNVVHGNLIAETGAGEINVESISGDADLGTGAGEITVCDVGGMLTISNGGGEIDADQVLTGMELNSGGGEITLSNLNGEISVNSGGGSVELADCEGNLRISTGGGSLDGRRICGRLAMSTGGGDVDLTEISASLDISTGGGDISAEMISTDSDIEHQITLYTGSGDIELTLPRHIKADIMALIRYRQRAWEDYSINSDFPLTVNKYTENKHQIIEGRGSINGGGQAIRLKAEAGDIHIRRH